MCVDRPGLGELTRRIVDVGERVEKSVELIDMELRAARVKELEAEAAVEGFWDNAEWARKRMQELDRHKAEIGKAQRWRERISDAYTAIDLLREFDDSEDSLELVAEAVEPLESLERELDEFDLQLTLSGPHDMCGALVTITAGAGGTDAQDWTELLARMITRFSERRGFSARLVEVSSGEECGYKSAALEIEGEFVYGLLTSERGTHRLVRISPFNSQGKRQTSFAGIEVMPILQEDDLLSVEVSDKDIEVTTVSNPSPPFPPPKKRPYTHAHPPNRRNGMRTVRGTD